MAACVSASDSISCGGCDGRACGGGALRCGRRVCCREACHTAAAACRGLDACHSSLSGMRGAREARSRDFSLTRRWRYNSVFPTLLQYLVARVADGTLLSKEIRWSTKRVCRQIKMEGSAPRTRSVRVYKAVTSRRGVSVLRDPHDKLPDLTLKLSATLVPQATSNSRVPRRHVFSIRLRRAAQQRSNNDNAYCNTRIAAEQHSRAARTANHAPPPPTRRVHCYNHRARAHAVGAAAAGHAEYKPTNVHEPDPEVQQVQAPDYSKR